MVYVGSKSRLAKHIVPILQEYINKHKIENYLEPFCGGCNIIDKIKCKNKFAYDLHNGLIEIYKGVQSGWYPPLHITEKEYHQAKNGEITEPLRSYIGFQGSYATKYWGGFARGFKADGVTPRNIYNERTRNFLEQIPNLLNITFEVKDFRDINANNHLIYCDPPYKDTTEYSTSKFPHDEFWQWVEKLSLNNVVIVSEFSASPNFKIIWQKERVCSLDKNTGGLKKVEKLFTLN